MSAARAKERAPTWASLPKSKLLDVRLCDLGVQLEGSWLWPLVERLWEELEHRGLPLRPHVWVSDEWASPDAIPGIQVPFYLLHPRLMHLERQEMHYVEGASRRDAMRLLRHEAGHAVHHAWALQRRPDWRRVFGTSRRYPTHYRPNPTSKSYVQHLPGWYAQSHPAEDFAETFAVWLSSRTSWRRRYTGWRALKKLEYVDALVQDLAERPRVVTSRARPQALRTRRKTLRRYYEEKKEHYGVGYDDVYDRDLRRLFSADAPAAKCPTAATFIRRRRRSMRESIGRWTGQHVFAVDQILDEMTGRCQELKLRAEGDPQKLERELAILITAHTVAALHVRQWRAL